jgi:CubicO group peptidase (beta-lactamase class C family)
VRFAFGLALATAAMAASATAQPAAEPAPGAAPAGTALPGSLVTEIDALFAAFTEPGSPGCALGISRAGSVAYARGYGLANLEHAVPITPRTVFDLGSTSKQMTAAVVWQLAAEGKLALDDDVRKLIPELPDLGAPVTLRHLVHHTSGIRDYIVLLELAGINVADRSTPQEALAMLARQRALDFPPGSAHAYSNSGYFLLALAAERAAGKPLRELAAERLFAPLGMADTQVLDDTSRVLPRRADSYARTAEGALARVTSRWEQTGDGAVQSTVEDLLRWADHLARPRAGQGDWVRELERPGTLADGTTLEYAGGLLVGEWRGARVISHGGSWMGFRADLLRFPEHDLAIAVLCNVAQAEPSALGRQVAALLLGDELAPEAPPAAPEDALEVPASPEAERRAGLYWSPASHLVRRLEARRGRLVYVRGPAAETPLRQVAPGRFAMVGVPVPTEVVFADAAGDRAGGGATAASAPAHDFSVTSAGQPPMPFVRVEPADPRPRELASLAGPYRSEELDTQWRLAVVDGELTAHGPREVKRAFAAVFADAFASPDGLLLRLVRGGDGTVTGFTVSAGRAHDILFARVPAHG